MINSVLSSFIFRRFCTIQPLISSRVQDNPEMEVSSHNKAPALNFVYRLWSSAQPGSVFCSFTHYKLQGTDIAREINWSIDASLWDWEINVFGAETALFILTSKLRSDRCDDIYCLAVPHTPKHVSIISSSRSWFTVSKAALKSNNH